MKSFFNSLYTTYEVPDEAQSPPPMLLIWRWICFYPARPENTENQPITNSKPRTFANTTVTSKKVKDSPEEYFFAHIYMMQAE